MNAGEAEPAPPSEPQPASQPDPLAAAPDASAQAPLPAASDGAGPSTVPSMQRTWPPGRPLAEGEAVRAACVACGTQWWIHHSMSGFRLRCDCGAWIEVPVDASRLPAVAAPAPEPVLLPMPALAPVPDERGLIALRMDRGEVYDGPISTALPMAPGALERGNVETRTRWTNRALLELTAVLGAILGPQLLANLLVAGQEGVLLMPFVSLISGMLVLAIAAVSGPYGTIGMRAASPLRWLEAMLAAPVGYGLALLWVTVLRAALGEQVEDDFLPELLSRLGPAWALVVIAASPALVEEIAFRGMLQGRLLALLGARNGFVVTAFAFTMAHMSPATMPIHFGLGLYLGWLRERSNSLLPGMLVHFTYNAMVLLLPM